MRFVLAAYCLTFDNARVERQTINTGRRLRRFSRLSSLISSLPRFGVLPDFHASIVRLTFETRKPFHCTRNPDSGSLPPKTATTSRKLFGL